jgi:hypothetical protein
MRQEYDEEDDKRHMQWLAKAFQDKRYIRVAGKPIFLVYRASMLPNPLRTTFVWREEAQRQGVGEIYLCKVESFSDEHHDPREMGFDAAVEFQPDWENLGMPLRRNRFWSWITRLGLADKVYQTNYVYDYASVIERMIKKKAPSYTRFPCVTPSWDNSPRRKFKAVIFKGSSPEFYGEWLRIVMEKVEIRNPDENFVFINAWNEWGEGNHLEPDRKWGRAYLEITRDILFSRNT